MIPSSRQWTSIPSADILVYPTLLYAISPIANKSLGAESRRSRSVQSVKSAATTSGGRPHSVAVRRRHSDFGGGGGGSRSTGGTPSRRRATDPVRSTGGTPSRRRAADPDRSSPSPSRRDNRRRGNRSSYNGNGGTGTATAHGHRSRAESPRSSDRQRWRQRREQERRSNVRGDGAPREASAVTAVDDGNSTRNVERDAIRISASVVLLAHGKRSLHVLTVQRCQSFVTSTPNARRGVRNHPTSSSSSTIVTRYKLPGGQVTLTDNEKENYKLEDRNTCSCPDDPRWYTAALKHFMVQHSQTDVSPRASSSELMPNSNDHQPQFVLLGKWYRTQNVDDRERTTNGNDNKDGDDNDDNDKNKGNGIGFDKNVPPPQRYYYPYKPAHISRQTVEHKRVYVIRDAVRLFDGPTPFQLRVPRAKTKTVTGPDGSISVTKTTTYKYKFIPLARLHENSRLYGPILSSLPVVLSSMNLVYLP